MRSDPRSGFSGKIDCNDARISRIPGISEDLLVQLSASLSDSHRAERAITGMGIRSENHFSAAGVHFTHILMDDCHMRRNKDPAVFLRCSQPKHMVIFIDRSADRIQRIMAAGENIRHREFIHPGGSRCLNNADISDIMGCQSVEFDAKLVHRVVLIVGLQDPIGNRSLLSLLRTDCLSCELLHFGSLGLGNDLRSVYKIDSAIIKFYHCVLLAIKYRLVPCHLGSTHKLSGRDLLPFTALVPRCSISQNYRFLKYYHDDSVFILHRAILVIFIMRYARKVKLVFIVSTISRCRIKASAAHCFTGALLRMLRHGGSQT